MENWRDKVSKDIYDYLEAQINESTKYKEAYESAPNKGQAQLWVAVATISKQIFDLNLKIKYLEGVLKEFDKKINEVTAEAKKILRESKEEMKKSVKDSDIKEIVKEIPKIEEKEEVKEVKIEGKTGKPRKTAKLKKKAKIIKAKKPKKKKISRKTKFKKIKGKKKSLAKVLKRF